MTLWFEFANRRGENIARAVTQVILHQQTEFQTLDVVDTVAHGRALFLDDKIQSAELDEFIYHEALVHPAMILAQAPRTVFIAVQAESTDIGVWDAHLAVVHTVRQVFPHVAPYRAHVPSFSESWGFLVASQTTDAATLDPAAVDAGLAAAGLSDLRFYDGITHQALFNLPRPLRQAQADWTRAISDAAPVVLDV